MSGRSTVEVLKAARKRIEDPERWTRGAFARTTDGASTPSTSPRAVCWCAEGAIEVEAGDLGSAAESLLRRAIGGSVLWLNDGPNPSLSGVSHPRKAPARHRKVLAAFDRAIELAESESQKEGERV